MAKQLVLPNWSQVWRLVSYKNWRLRNIRRARQYDFDRWRNNKAEIDAKRKAWAIANPGKVLEKNALKRLHRKSAEERVKGAIQAKKWRKANPDKARAILLRKLKSGKVAEYYHRRRARVSQNGYTNCFHAIKLLQSMPLCQYCFRLIPGRPSIDHIVPISRGGMHVPENLVAVCRPCNSSKGRKLLSEWVGRIGG